jgi:hypothetical protein
VRQARARAGLTLEKASLLSHEISQYLGRAQYAIAQSTLSEYEAQDAPPRHLEKVMTLCLLYGIRLSELVAASGTAHDELGQQAMPAHMMPGRPFGEVFREQRKASPLETGTTSSLIEKIGAVPWFLASSLQRISGISHPSLRDFYWLSGNQPFLPTHTGGSMFALVDRRKKKPVRLPNSPSWQQPAWVLIDRRGEYRCACCGLEGETLVLYPESDRTRSPEVLLLGRDVEVVGQIVAVARRIPTCSGTPVAHLSPAEISGDIEQS